MSLSVDGRMAFSLIAVMDITGSILAKLVAVMLFSPIFILPGLILGGLGAFIAQMYMKATLSVKREMSNAKAPIIATVGGALAGLRTFYYPAHSAPPSDMLILQLLSVLTVPRTYSDKSRGHGSIGTPVLLGRSTT